ncbi:hypothetical protein BDV96DRAFT_584879 [Lophiotrema nucula]|uniref:Uncharacterized protein n=1 Tax=Lophiotrema nucula TaxID=690887 RepID=A0A6A5YSB3_9PLEO|nr:hypothetical protein BDV96DRAFT_584879 [Lophiotrema nucula]
MAERRKSAHSANQPGLSRLNPAFRQSPSPTNQYSSQLNAPQPDRHSSPYMTTGSSSENSALASSSDFRPSSGLLSDLVLHEPLEPISRREIELLKKSINKDQKRQVPVTLPAPSSIYDAARAKVQLVDFDYANILRTYGYVAMIDAAYSESRKAGHPFHQDPDDQLADLEFWRYHGLNILASTPRKILESVLTGDLPNKTSSEGSPDEELLHYFDQEDEQPKSSWRARQDASFAPCAYVRYLVDSSGKTLTGNELRLVVQRMREYVSGDPQFDQQNAKIDNESRHGQHTTAEDIRAGHHYHLDGTESRVQIILATCFAIEVYLDTLLKKPLDAEAPLPRPVCCFGYAAKGRHRLEQHTLGNTSFISALILGICKREFRANGVPIFSMKGLVICYFINWLECKLGEELFSRIGGSYYYTGTGLNVAPAGLSNASGNLGQHTHNEANDKWQQCVEFRYKYGDYVPQLRKELKEQLPVYQQLKEAGPSRRDQKQQLKAEIKSLSESNLKLKDEVAAAYGEMQAEHRAAIEAIPEEQSELRRGLESHFLTVETEFKGKAKDIFGEDWSVPSNPGNSCAGYLGDQCPTVGQASIDANGKLP